MTSKPPKAAVRPGICVIGIGEDGLSGLSARARDIIDGADVLVGGARHLAFVEDGAARRIDWSDGIDAVLDTLEPQLNKQIVILASGDPLYFGVAKNVIERFGAARVQVIPVPGAVSLTCAAMGWSQPDIQVVTVHGRPLQSLNLYLTPGAKLVVLSHDGDTPAQVASLLSDQGFGPSLITVLEHLGGELENRCQGLAASWAHPQAANLNTVAIDLKADQTARPLSRLAGLPDDAFNHDGQLTKRAVRAVTLSSLAPLPGQMLWDLGAGAGSISIEWMRAHCSNQAVAVERDPLRAKRIGENAAHLGVPKLNVEVAENMHAIETLEGNPDAIFIGGGIMAPGLVDAAWARLKPGGRLVANAVTDESRALLITLKQTYGGALMDISISGKLPITQYVVEKTK
jgi:precorrin-6Y C5,15-methyltransferase (decarboxylating)